MQRDVQRHKAYRHLRSLLVRGGLPPGCRLGEADWSGRLEVHRGALREAFVLLAHEGLLEPGDRGGYFVPTLGQVDRDEVLELRLALELGAIRRLAKSDAPVCTESLEAMCHAMRQMVELDMPQGYAEVDRRFHEALVELSGNRQLIRAYQHSPLRIVLSDQLDVVERRQVMQQTLDDHCRLCDLLAAGQFTHAAGLLERHLITYRDKSTLNCALTI